ncbi:hypothetical protein C1H76_2707 [Elsinoe australis]|uniref:Uncharacterized protein n=1 Tax=Elsinoe australis TaxID=40998 RepID=A0A4U7B648_9PEZI|nr:hypothetical protein C1H76_2707 [Elsinoe australis]
MASTSAEAQAAVAFLNEALLGYEERLSKLQKPVSGVDLSASIDQIFPSEHEPDTTGSKHNRLWLLDQQRLHDHQLWAAARNETPERREERSRGLEQMLKKAMK